MKTCIRCKQTKPLDDFHKVKRFADGHHYYCKSCKADEYKELKKRREIERATVGLPTSKSCTRCGEIKPLSCFHKKASNIDGHSRVCVECTKQEYVANDKRAYSQQRYQENKDKILEQTRRWKQENKEHKRDQAREYRQRKHADRLEYNREYYRRNKDRVRARVQRYCEENKDLRNTYNHTRRAKVYNNGGSHTVQEWRALVEKYEHRCLACGVVSSKLHADHVIPVTKGGTSNIDNLQPLCHSCNSRKNAKTIDYRPVVAVVWPLLKLLEVE